MTTTTRQATRRMSLLDTAFVNVETRDTPMHIGGLQIFSLPPNAPPDFVKNIVRRFRNTSVVGRPFNMKLEKTLWARIAPSMIVVDADDIDLSYHVRHSALPDPGGERELGELVSHLHSQLLDRSRPLWTCHVIEGLQNNRFAIYSKMHHALADGISAMRLSARALSTEPDGEWFPAWEHREPTQKRKRTHDSARTVAAKLTAREWPQIMKQAFQPMFKREVGSESVLRPFEAPPSILNGEVTGARRVATQQLDMERMKRVAKAAGGSLNDVFLAICSSALRRHLLSQDALPDRSLIAGVPVSLREAGDDSMGNAIGFLWTALGTELTDPKARFAAIRSSMEVSKNHLKSLPQQARVAFTLLTSMPTALVLMSGLGAKVRPPMNLTISNVPGPEHVLYLNGAKLEATFPISIPVQGQALNITCVSYAGQLNVGFTGSRDSLPGLQKMAVYAGEALTELETVFGVIPA